MMETLDASATAQNPNKEDVEFFIYRAKIEPCTRTEPHSHSSCPFLHPEEGCPRRDPMVYKYDSVFCYDLHHTKVCKRGVNCPYSHNLFEYFLHPSRYRTRMCEYGDKCKRELCFFAHSDSELRERTAIKIHSGGRRSGRRHRAAMAMRAANGAAGPNANGNGGLYFLQVPNMPLPDANNAAGAALQLDAPAHDALPGLALGAADLGAQQAGMGPLGAPQLQLAQNPPVLILQEGPAGNSAEVLPNLGHIPASAPVIAAGNAPLGMGVLHGNSNISTLAGLAANGVQANCPLVISAQTLGHGPGMLSLASSQALSQTIPGNLLLTSNSMQAAAPAQQAPYLVSTGSAQVVPAMLQAIAPAAPAGGYILLAADQIGAAISAPALQVQQQQMNMQLAPAGILPQALPPAVAGQHMVLLLHPMQQL